MSGKNQHFIPQFLQRGFASCSKTDKSSTSKGFDKNVKPSKKKEAQVWVFEKGKKPYLTNIRNKGAERFFYGSEDSLLDKMITEAETKYAVIANQLRDLTSDSVLDDPLIAELVVHLSVRTKHFRTSVEQLGDLGLDMIQGFFQDPLDFEKFLFSHFQKNPNILQQEFNQILSVCTPDQQRIIKTEIQRNPSLLDNLLRNSIAEMNSIHPILMDSFESLKNDVQNMSKNAHIKSLSESIIPEKRVEKLRDLNWFLCVQVPGSYILSDAGALCCTSNAQYKPLISGDEDIQDVFLPISSQHLLIGSIEPILKKTEIEAINQSSAAISKNFFIAGQHTQREITYAQQIDSKNSLISEEKLVAIEAELYEKWLD
jgi:hypothetical protein